MDGNFTYTYRQEPADGVCQRTVGYLVTPRENTIMNFLTQNRGFRI